MNSRLAPGLIVAAGRCGVSGIQFMSESAHTTYAWYTGRLWGLSVHIQAYRLFCTRGQDSLWVYPVGRQPARGDAPGNLAILAVLPAQAEGTTTTGSDKSRPIPGCKYLVVSRGGEEIGL
jgi:hypothetical protein